MKGLVVAVLLLCGLIATAGLLGLRADEPGPVVAADQILESFDIPKHGDCIVVPVTIEGKKKLFLVDTGCTSTAFDSSLLTELHTETKTAISPSGNMAVKIYRAPPATLGRLEFPKDQLVAGLDLTRIRELFGHEIYGVLGMDFLKNYVWHFDFDEGKLLILKSVIPKQANPVALRYNELGSPTIAVQIGDLGKEEFLLDTGAWGSGCGDLKATFFDFLQLLERVKVFSSTPWEDVHGVGRSRLGRLPELTVGEFKINNPILGELKLCNLLGLSFLSRFVVTLDFPNNALYLKAGKTFHHPDTINASGICLIRKNGKKCVHLVDKGSAGELAGVKVGDMIIAVDGVGVEQQSLFEFGRQFHVEGRTFALTLQRGEQVLQVSLVLKKDQ